MYHYNGDVLIFCLALNTNAFVDGVRNAFSLHIEPPHILYFHTKKWSNLPDRLFECYEYIPFSVKSCNQN